MQTETGEVNPDHSSTTEDITAQGITTHIEDALDHYIMTVEITAGVAHNDLAQFTEATIITIDLTMTHHIYHIAVFDYIKALQDTEPEITVGHTKNHLTDLQGMNYVDQAHNPAG